MLPRDPKELGVLRDLRRLQDMLPTRTDAAATMRRILDSAFTELRREAVQAATDHVVARGMLDLLVDRAQNDHDVAVRAACIQALGSALSEFHAVHGLGLARSAVIRIRAATRARDALLGIARDERQPEECRREAGAALDREDESDDVIPF